MPIDILALALSLSNDQAVPEEARDQLRQVLAAPEKAVSPAIVYPKGSSPPGMSGTYVQTWGDPPPTGGNPEDWIGYSQAQPGGDWVESWYQGTDGAWYLSSLVEDDPDWHEYWGQAHGQTLVETTPPTLDELELSAEELEVLKREELI